MSTAQVTQAAQTYPKFIIWRTVWARGNLGFGPIMQRYEVPVRNLEVEPARLVFIYESEEQSTYSRTYNKLVVAVRVEDAEEEARVITKISELLLEVDRNYLNIEDYDTLELIKELINIVEEPVAYKLNVDEDFYYYRKVKLIVY